MRATIKSKLIDEIDYDEQREHLRIYLTSGQLRDFRLVPLDVVSGLMSSRSPGQFYVENIRDKFDRVQ